MTSLAADWVFPVTAPPIAAGAVDIAADGTIAAIRPANPSDRPMRGVCLLPGLINAHTHLAYTAFRNKFAGLPFFPWIRRLTEEKQKWQEDRVRASTRLGILETLRGGITCVADLCDQEPALAILSESPLRGIFYKEVFGVEKDQADLAWHELQDAYPRMCDRYGTVRLRVGVSPHACYTVRPELYRKIADWSRKEKIPVSFHLSESREEQEFISRRSGVIHEFLRDRASDWKILGGTPVAHLEKTGILDTRPLLAHLVQVNAGDIEILRYHDAAVAHCPKSNANFAHGTAPLSDFLAAGLNVGLGTDSAASGNSLDLFEEARSALLQQRVRDARAIITEELILEMWTIGGARAMGLDGQVGSLEAGKQADLIGVSVPPYYSSSDEVLRHLVHDAATADVCLVMVGGRLLDLPALVEESRETAVRLSLDEQATSQ